MSPELNPYRELGAVEPDRSRPRVQLSFWGRWHATCSLATGLLGTTVALFFATSVPLLPLLFWSPVFVAIGAFVERRWLLPGRIRDAELIAWFEAMMRSINEGDDFEASTWRERFAKEKWVS
jgi:hypothetical protein